MPGVALQGDLCEHSDIKVRLGEDTVWGSVDKRVNIAWYLAKIENHPPGYTRYSWTVYLAGLPAADFYERSELRFARNRKRLTPKERSELMTVHEMTRPPSTMVTAQRGIFIREAQETMLATVQKELFPPTRWSSGGATASIMDAAVQPIIERVKRCLGAPPGVLNMDGHRVINFQFAFPLETISVSIRWI